MPDAIGSDATHTIGPAHGGAGALSPAERRYRIFEFVALFGAVPGVLAFGPTKLPLFVMLGTAAAACTAMLLLDRTFDRRQLWNWGALRRALPGVLGLWLLGVLAIGAIVWWALPEAFLKLPRERPGRWLMICLCYPLLSVYPQNIVYRAFIMHRYRGVFTGETAMLWASAGAFAWAHVIFHNAVAVALTLAGGLIFARTYQQHRSTLLVSIEHALYGLLMFTAGLGHTLYLGGVR